jgi:septal ring factor EnvC (AmiA/AmiB activator)
MSAIIKQMSIALILMIGVTMVMSTAVQAQPKRMSIEKQIKILEKKLKLNAEQSSKITTILEDLREEMTTATNEHRGDREAMHTAMQEMMKKTNSQIKAILTEEQAVKYDEILKERRERMEKRMQKSDNQ